jgi:hypothetical protein
LRLIAIELVVWTLNATEASLVRESDIKVARLPVIYFSSAEKKHETQPGF